MEHKTRMEKKLHDRTDLGKLVTFVPNKNEPVYNWFYYKEGYARELVLQIIDMFQLKKSSTVLDPFCGSGTTLVACKERGIAAIGIDVLPVCIFAAQVKTRTYDENQLIPWAKKLWKTKYTAQKYQVPPSIKRAFNIHILDDIIMLQNAIEEIDDVYIRDFFRLALIRATMKVTYAFKDGGVIKIRKKHVPSFRQMFKRTTLGMIKDIQNTTFQDTPVQVMQGDARMPEIENSSIDAVITSPPYLNNIDYTKVYEIEEFFIRGKEHPALRSYIGKTGIEENTLDENLPPEAVSYFKDMNQVLVEMHRVLKSGGKAAIIVGNGYVAGKIIESDIILAELAENAGFTVERIDVFNERFALEKRTMKKGILRESMIVMQKR